MLCPAGLETTGASGIRPRCLYCHYPQSADNRHFPVAVGGAANDAAEHTPVGQIGGLMGDDEVPAADAAFVEMVAVAWRNSGKACGKRRRLI